MPRFILVTILSIFVVTASTNQVNAGAMSRLPTQEGQETAAEEDAAYNLKIEWQRFSDAAREAARKREAAGTETEDERPHDIAQRVIAAQHYDEFPYQGALEKLLAENG